MTVEIWYGRWPEHRGEQQALVEVCHFLEQQMEHYLVMTQFSVGQGGEIDCVIIKPQQIFLVEWKEAGGNKIVGQAEGDWIIIGPEGTEVRLPKNPVGQLKRYHFHFKKWLDENQDQICKDTVHSSPVSFQKAMRSYIVITPDLNPESEIRTPFYITTLGMDKFVLSLEVTKAPQFELTQKEIKRIPKLLKLTEWNRTTRKLEHDWQRTAFTGLISLSQKAVRPILNFNKLDKDIITIGREANNDLVINDDTVSRHHAQIKRIEGRFVVEDLESTSGTFVNYKGDPEVSERVIPKGGTNAIKNRSIIRFGTTAFVFLEEQ